MITETTPDLSSILQRDAIDPPSYDELKQLAFSGTESLHRFRQLVAELEQQAEAGDPAAGQAALKLGMCHLLLADAARAAHWLEKAEDGEAKAHYLGQAYRELERHRESAGQFEQAARFATDRLYYECQRAESLARLGELEEARRVLEASSADGQASPDWHYAKGRYWQCAGEWERAIDEYECALKSGAEHVGATFHLAYLLHLHGSDERARTLYEELADRPVAHADALMNLALIYEDEGRFEEAARCLRRVVAVQPANERAQLFLKDVTAAEHMFIDEQQVIDAEKRSAVLDIPVSDFELSVRSRNCLKKMNINTLGDLLRTTEAELLSYKNFGETSLKEIKVMLDQKGLVLGQLARDGLQLVPPSEADEAEPDNGAASETGVAPEIWSKPVAALELSVRSRKCLHQHGIQTLGELTGYTEAELTSSQNFGQASLDEIKKCLATFGLSLKSS